MYIDSFYYNAYNGYIGKLNFWCNFVGITEKNKIRKKKVNHAKIKKESLGRINTPIILDINKISINIMSTSIHIFLFY